MGAIVALTLDAGRLIAYTRYGLQTAQPIDGEGHVMVRLVSRAFIVSFLAFGIADAKPARRFFEPEQPREIRNLTGTYTLSYKGATGAPGSPRMKIWNQQGNSFLISIAELANHPAVDWEGRGVFDGERGHYDWVFPDGKKGRTTFTVDKGGHIHGQVRGGGIDWDYVGRRVEKPAAK